MNNPAAARAKAERALSIVAAAEAVPTRLAEARFELAQSLWSDPAARPRPIELAEQASDTLAKFGGPDPDALPEVDGWLAAHDP